MSFDSVQDNKAFAEKQKFPYPLLSDPARSVGLPYGAADEAGTGGYAKRIAYIIGTDGKIRNVFPKATPASFVGDILALL